MANPHIAAPLHPSLVAEAKLKTLRTKANNRTPADVLEMLNLLADQVVDNIAERRRNVPPVVPTPIRAPYKP